MKKFLLATVLSLLTTTTFAQFKTECPFFFPNNKPPTIKSPSLRQLCFESFAVLYSGESKTPVYVVERLTREQLADAKGEQRTDRFYEEARLPVQFRASSDDYKHSGFDRGHMAPAGDMPTANAMAQSFSFANMVPQSPKLNRGLWADIERDTRHYVNRTSGPVYVFTGPLFLTKPQPTIGQNKVWIPSHTFKLVLDYGLNRSWVHLLPNSDDVKMNAPITYSEFVKLSNLNLLD